MRKLKTTLSSLALLGVLYATPGGAVPHAEPGESSADRLCPSSGANEASNPVLVLGTQLGEIEIELLEDAAPEAVRWLARLAQGPLFHPDLVPPAAAPVGFYEGLGFDFTRAHVDLATETRRPADHFTTETRIDAEALGLDRQRIADPAEAMTVLQRELLPELIRNKKRGSISPRLRQWANRWYERQEPDFLVGESRQAVNEALGYVYERGLASPPPDRGAVALWPESPRRSTARLTIFLADLPERAGRWMVVGRVTRGLEVAEAIASRPLAPGVSQSQGRPLDPVVIDTTTVECRTVPEPRDANPQEK